MSGRRGLRIAVVLLLLSAAYWAALPWLTCATPPHALLPSLGPLLGVCTVGVGSSGGASAFGGYGVNLAFGIFYLASAAFVAVTKRPL
jgi:hypothetical protein